MLSCHAQTYADFRQHARLLWANHIHPHDVLWHEEPSTLFNATPPTTSPLATASTALQVPRAFIQLAEKVACHRNPQRFDWLYQALWSLTHGQPRLLHNPADPLTRRLQLMAQQVGRDVHKMHAFVRFQQVQQGGVTIYLAWHQPDHRILALAAPFFVERFRNQHWGIATPDASCSWLNPHLLFGPGVPRLQLPEADPAVALWQTYYRHVFNPARLKTAMMTREMPKRHWATLPEAALISGMVAESAARVEAMLRPAIPGSKRSSLRAKRVLAAHHRKRAYLSKPCLRFGAR